MKKLKECCVYIHLSIQDEKIVVTGDTIRFSSYVIDYCPFCGTKLKFKKKVMVEETNTYNAMNILNAIKSGALDYKFIKLVYEK